MEVAGTAAIVGCGLIGRSWAISFARGGWQVRLFDRDADTAAAALEAVGRGADELAGWGLLDGQTAAEVRERVTVIAGSLDEAVARADHVQENTPEHADLKAAIFAELDRLAPAEAVIASSTSAMLPSAFTAKLAGRSRTLVVHPLNPPHLVPAVEIVPSPWTSAATVARTAATMAEIGQAPVVLIREVEGFVMNRLQGALLHEAFNLVAEGIASPADVDKAVAEGLGLRWSFMGPFETIDLNAPGGITDFIARYGPTYARMSPPVAQPVSWDGLVGAQIEMARAAHLPRDAIAPRQAWRDGRLMRLAAHKREIARVPLADTPAPAIDVEGPKIDPNR